MLLRLLHFVRPPDGVDIILVTEESRDLLERPALRLGHVEKLEDSSNGGLKGDKRIDLLELPIRLTQAAKTK